MIKFSALEWWRWSLQQLARNRKLPPELFLHLQDSLFRVHLPKVTPRKLHSKIKAPENSLICLHLHQECKFRLPDLSDEVHTRPWSIMATNSRYLFPGFYFLAKHFIYLFIHTLIIYWWDDDYFDYEKSNKGKPNGLLYFNVCIFRFILLQMFSCKLSITITFKPLNVRH